MTSFHEFQKIEYIYTHNYNIESQFSLLNAWWLAVKSNKNFYGCSLKKTWAAMWLH